MKKTWFAKNIMLSFLFALLITLAISSIVYVSASNSISTMTLESNRTVLRQAQGLLEERLSSVDNILQTISNNVNLSYFLLNRRFDGDAYYNVWKFQTDLKQDIATELFISDIYVFFYNNDLVVTNRTSYKKSGFYGKFFKFGSLSADAFASLIEGIYTEPRRFIASTQVMTETGSYRALAYFKTIPMNVARKYAASVMVLIDQQKLLSYLSAVNIFDTGYTYVLDADGEVIVSLQADKAEPVYVRDFAAQGQAERVVNGRRLTFVRHVSDASGWQFIAAVPTGKLLAPARQLQGMTIIGSFSSLVLGLGVSYSLVRKRTRPLDRAMGSLKALYQDDGKVKYPFSYVSEKIETLVADNDRFRSKASVDNRLLERLCVSAVLRGGGEAMGDSLYQLGMQGSRYNAVVLAADAQQPPEWYTAFFEKRAWTQLEGRVLFIHNEGCVFHALISHQTDAAQEAMEQAVACMTSLWRDLTEAGLACGVCVGRLCGEINDVVLSFYDACDLHAASAQGVMVYSPPDKRGGVYAYSVDTEARLIEQIRTGKTEAASALLNKIYDDNFKAEKLSLKMTAMLFDELQGTLLKVSGDTKDSLALDTSDHEALFQAIREALLRLSEAYRERLIDNSSMGMKMLQYVETHAHDNALSLNSLAAAFGLSESYVSKCFKDSTGVNFRTYLEDLRMQQAVKLLARGEMTVNEIAQRIGYLNDKSFRRAYKKCMGEPPKGFGKGE